MEAGRKGGPLKCKGHAPGRAEGGLHVLSTLRHAEEPPHPKYRLGICETSKNSYNAIWAFALVFHKKIAARVVWWFRAT